MSLRKKLFLIKKRSVLQSTLKITDLEITDSLKITDVFRETVSVYYSKLRDIEIHLHLS